MTGFFRKERKRTYEKKKIFIISSDSRFGCDDGNYFLRVRGHSGKHNYHSNKDSNGWSFRPKKATDIVRDLGMFSPAKGSTKVEIDKLTGKAKVTFTTTPLARKYTKLALVETAQTAKTKEYVVSESEHR